MKKVLYTQRVEIVEGYGERRDCVDQKIPEFLLTCGYFPVPVPNVIRVAERMIQELSPSGILLTGGNSLVKYGGQAPERDQVEKALMDLSIEKGIPIYGICRGMQFILDYFGCKLVEINGHVAVSHKLKDGRSVNSYHNLGCFSVVDAFEALGIAEDGVIEEIKHRKIDVSAAMWHPEREAQFRDQDIKTIQNLFK